jgi:hypothetical protein
MNRQNSPVPLIIIILAALVIFMVTSCKPDNYKEPIVTANPNRYELSSTSEYSDRVYRTYTLEGCEYVVVGMGNFQWGSHKGNCKNQIHKENASN